MQRKYMNIIYIAEGVVFHAVRVVPSLRKLVDVGCLRLTDGRAYWRVDPIGSGPRKSLMGQNIQNHYTICQFAISLRQLGFVPVEGNANACDGAPSLLLCIQPNVKRCYFGLHYLCKAPT